MRAVEECLGWASGSWRQQVTLTPQPGLSLDPVLCRSLSVTDLAVLLRRDKRKMGKPGP